MRWLVVLVVVCACGDSDESGGRSKRDRKDGDRDRDDKAEKKDRLSCEDAVDGYVRDKDRKADLVRRCIKDEWSRRMRRCVSEAESRSDFQACEREHDPDAKKKSAMWDHMATYADKVCACRDTDCITKAGEEWVKVASELAKDAAGKAGDMSDDDKRRGEEISKKIAECTKRVVEESVKASGW
jgi:hypothetical protein